MRSWSRSAIPMPWSATLISTTVVAPSPPADDGHPGAARGCSATALSSRLRSAVISCSRDAAHAARARRSHRRSIVLGQRGRADEVERLGDDVVDRRPARRASAASSPCSRDSSISSLTIDDSRAASCCIRPANRTHRLGVVGGALDRLGEQRQRADRRLELVRDVGDEVAAYVVDPGRLGPVVGQRRATRSARERRHPYGQQQPRAARRRRRGSRSNVRTSAPDPDGTHRAHDRPRRPGGRRAPGPRRAPRGWPRRAASPSSHDDRAGPQGGEHRGDARREPLGRASRGVGPRSWRLRSVARAAMARSADQHADDEPRRPLPSTRPQYELVCAVAVRRHARDRGHGASSTVHPWSGAAFTVRRRSCDPVVRRAVTARKCGPGVSTTERPVHA